MPKPAKQPDDDANAEAEKADLRLSLGLGEEPEPNSDEAAVIQGIRTELRHLVDTVTERLKAINPIEPLTIVGEENADEAKLAILWVLREVKRLMFDVTGTIYETKNIADINLADEELEDIGTIAGYRVQELGDDAPVELQTGFLKIYSAMEARGLGHGSLSRTANRVNERLDMIEETFEEMVAEEYAAEQQAAQQEPQNRNERRRAKSRRS